jgi:predicted O-methyltransferase YrrM
MKTREGLETAYWHSFAFLRAAPSLARGRAAKVGIAAQLWTSRALLALSWKLQRSRQTLGPRNYVDLREVRKFSMLDVSVLRELQKAARKGKGGIFDVGPYIGGSTVAMASGHRGRRKHVVIEAGGAYADQPFLPSLDIIGDLTRNLGRYGLLEHVTIYQGWSDDPSIFEPAIRELGNIGLFFFDANGAVAEQLAICAPCLQENCTVILDDINTEQAKAAMVLPTLNRLIAEGALIEDKVIQGTWFGRLGKADRAAFAHYRHDSGHAWLMRAPDPQVWRVELFENGKPLGPAETLHDEIRQVGKGAWSHWTFSGIPMVLFSASDSSDPNENGRRYTLKSYPRM